MVFRFPETSSAAEAHLYLREEQMRQSYEALLLAARVLNAACDPILQEVGLGKAHHRVLFLIAVHDGVTPGVLLERLGITKQSLGRVLNDLKKRGFVEPGRDPRDRRLRPLRLTPAGRQLEQKLFQELRYIMTRAYREAGGGAVDGFRQVLSALNFLPGEGDE